MSLSALPSTSMPMSEATIQSLPITTAEESLPWLSEEETMHISMPRPRPIPQAISAADLWTRTLEDALPSLTPTQTQDRSISSSFLPNNNSDSPFKMSGFVEHGDSLKQQALLKLLSDFMSENPRKSILGTLPSRFLYQETKAADFHIQSHLQSVLSCSPPNIEAATSLTTHRFAAHDDLHWQRTPSTLPSQFSRDKHHRRSVWSSSLRPAQVNAEFKMNRPRDHGDAAGPYLPLTLPSPAQLVQDQTGNSATSTWSTDVPSNEPGSSMQHTLPPQYELDELADMLGIQHPWTGAPLVQPMGGWNTANSAGHVGLGGVTCATGHVPGPPPQLSDQQWNSASPGFEWDAVFDDFDYTSMNMGDMDFTGYPEGVPPPAPPPGGTFNGGSISQSTRNDGLWTSSQSYFQGQAAGASIPQDTQNGSYAVPMGNTISRQTAWVPSQQNLPPAGFNGNFGDNYIPQNGQNDGYVMPTRNFLQGQTAEGSSQQKMHWNNSSNYIPSDYAATPRDLHHHAPPFQGQHSQPVRGREAPSDSSSNPNQRFPPGRTIEGPSQQNLYRNHPSDHIPSGYTSPSPDLQRRASSFRGWDARSAVGRDLSRTSEVRQQPQPRENLAYTKSENEKAFEKNEKLLNRILAAATESQNSTFAQANILRGCSKLIRRHKDLDRFASPARQEELVKEMKAAFRNTYDISNDAQRFVKRARNMDSFWKEEELDEMVWDIMGNMATAQTGASVLMRHTKNPPKNQTVFETFDERFEVGCAVLRQSKIRCKGLTDDSHRVRFANAPRLNQHDKRVKVDTSLKQSRAPPVEDSEDEDENKDDGMQHSTMDTNVKNKHSQSRTLSNEDGDFDDHGMQHSTMRTNMRNESPQTSLRQNYDGKFEAMVDNGRSERGGYNAIAQDNGSYDGYQGHPNDQDILDGYPPQPNDQDPSNGYSAQSDHRAPSVVANSYASHNRDGPANGRSPRDSTPRRPSNLSSVRYSTPQPSQDPRAVRQGIHSHLTRPGPGRSSAIPEYRPSKPNLPRTAAEKKRSKAPVNSVDVDDDDDDPSPEPSSKRRRKTEPELPRASASSRGMMNERSNSAFD